MNQIVQHASCVCALYYVILRIEAVGLPSQLGSVSRIGRSCSNVSVKGTLVPIARISEGSLCCTVVLYGCIFWGLCLLLCLPSVEGLGSPSYMMAFLAPLYISRIMATWCYFSSSSKYSCRATRANPIECENLMTSSVDPNSRKAGT